MHKIYNTQQMLLKNPPCQQSILTGTATAGMSKENLGISLVSMLWLSRLIEGVSGRSAQ